MQAAGKQLIIMMQAAGKQLIIMIMMQTTTMATRLSIDENNKKKFSKIK